MASRSDARSTLTAAGFVGGADGGAAAGGADGGLPRAVPIAAQVLSVVQALDSETFCREKLNRAPLGAVSEDKLNVEGGSIAIGHPFGATGARITLSLVNELRRRGGGLGLVGVCAAGGIGFSMVVESE